jgi:hypothetical protein
MCFSKRSIEAPVGKTDYANYMNRQHLSRRHMLSFRCQTCWRSFDNKTKLADHTQSTFCPKRPRLESERFMQVEHESEVEKPCGSISEEETWWGLFQLLIPGMDTQSTAWIKSQYYPCMGTFPFGGHPL